jgi:hypothetical protein
LHTNPVWAQIQQYSTNNNFSLPPSTQLAPGQLLLAFQALSTSHEPPSSSSSASDKNDHDSQSSYAPHMPPIPIQLDKEEDPADDDQLVHGYNADYDFGEFS